MLNDRARYAERPSNRPQLILAYRRERTMEGRPDHGQPVRDDQRCPPGQHGRQCSLDRRLGLGVQVRGRLVEVLNSAHVLEAQYQAARIAGPASVLSSKRCSPSLSSATAR